MVRLFYLLCMLLACWPLSLAAAGSELLPVDADPEQLRGQAVVLLSLRNERALRGLRVEAVDRRQRVSLGPFSDGIHLQVISLPPGRYRIAGMRLAGSRDWIESETGVGVAFDVLAQAINYPGDLLLSEVPGSERMVQRLSNRSARVWERLRQQQPRLIEAWSLRYAGATPDPFPALWKSLPEASSEPSPPPLQADGAAVAPARDYFRPRAIGDLSLSPDGRLLALSQAEDGRLRLWLIDLDTRLRVDLRKRLRSDSKLQWCGKRCLSVTSGDPSHVAVLKLRMGSQGWTARRSLVPAPGYVVDPLPLQEGRLLFGRTDNPSGSDSLEVYDLDLRGRIDAAQLAHGRRLDRGVSGDFGWVSDSQGRLAAALLRQGERYLIQHQNAAGDWQTLIEATPEAQYDPIGLDDHHGLYALSEQQRDARALVRTDLGSGQTQTIAAQPGADLVGVVLSPDQRLPLAVRYFEHNRLRSRLLNAGQQPRLLALEALHDGASLALTQISADGARWLYYTDSRELGGQWWLQDGPEADPFLIGSYRPWLKSEARSTARSLSLQTADGLTLEAVLVEPAPATTPLPVVVLAHGGPIGVRDSMLFDPQAQYLASQGLAVLKVNFRGSGGYGRGFRNAGYGQAGAAIEADILAALEQLLSDPRYDRGRVCAMGSSYGGYSALMLAIRAPALIRCVVALAPVTDLPLRFSSSDWNTDALQMAFQQRLYGDPVTALQSQVAQSPVYQYRQLQAAVLLGHGERDARVDPEHSRRLALVLARSGRPAPVLWYANEAHGLERVDNLTDWMRHAAGFIHQQLRSPVAATAVEVSPERLP